MLNIVKKRTLYYTISALLFGLALVFLFVIKLNLGIDMTGGTQTEYNYNSALNIEKIRNEVSDLKEKNSSISSVDVYKVTGEKKFVITTGYDSNIDDTSLEKVKNDFRNNILAKLKNIDSEITESQYINIGKSFGDYIKNTAIMTLFIAIFAIALYLAYSFSGVLTGWKIIFSFSSITVITLFHDVLITTGFYIFTSYFFTEFKVDTFFITALLTILGYSINDTIVVFDRIRHNLKKYVKKKGKSLDEIIDISINETFTRSIYTSLTLVFVLVSILLFGPESIKGFVLTMIYGTIIGTYSSIFIASPLLYELNKNKDLKIYEKKERSIEDKIVV